MEDHFPIIRLLGDRPLNSNSYELLDFALALTHCFTQAHVVAMLDMPPYVDGSHSSRCYLADGPQSRILKIIFLTFHDKS